jgi:hypothetical protein
VDPTSLIFVALAIAWAVYLIPKAVKHHDEVVRSRSVDRFSQTMRVLARREPVSRRNARLVVTPGRGAQAPIVTKKATAAPEEPTPQVPAALSRAAVQRATRRRRRVLGLILLSLVAVAVCAAVGLFSWAYVALPAGVLVAWLVACRVMVKSERRVGVPASVAASTAPDHQVPASATCPDLDSAYEGAYSLDDTSTTPAITDPTLWDPVPVTLPTYVTKPTAARRTVRTIDLDATGVWTSGRTESDAQLAREADAADAAARAERTADEADRAFGS